MPRIAATARNIKVTPVLDTAAFAALQLPVGAPARSEVTVSVNGRWFCADVATKSVRRVLATIAEHGADGVVVLIQGTLGAGDEIHRSRIGGAARGAGEGRSSVSETEAREERFYWVILGQNPPEIAFWERDEWWLASDPKPWRPEAVTVVGDRLIFTPPLKPGA